MKKKILLDLHVLDLIIENKSVDADRIKSYSHDLLIYGQKELYTIFYIENDLVLCKNQDQISELLIENKVEKLEYSQLDVSDHEYSIMVDLSRHAAKNKIEISEDIIEISEYTPFQRDKYTTIEIIYLMIKYEIDYLLTLNPFIKLDFLYLKSAVNSLSNINKLKIGIHL